MSPTKTLDIRQPDTTQGARELIFQVSVYTTAHHDIVGNFLCKWSGSHFSARETEQDQQAAVSEVLEKTEWTLGDRASSDGQIIQLQIKPYIFNQSNFSGRKFKDGGMESGSRSHLGIPCLVSVPENTGSSSRCKGRRPQGTKSG